MIRLVGGVHAADARVQFAQINLVGFDIQKVINAENALVAFLVEPVAELARHFAHLFRHVVGQERRRRVIAAPAALVRGHLGEPGDVGHHRAHQRAVTRGAALDRTGQVLDMFHHLQLLVDDLGRVFVPVPFGLDEKGCSAAVTIRCLNHQVLAQPSFIGQLHQLLITVGVPHDIRRRGNAGLIAQLSCHDLAIEVFAHGGGCKRNLDPCICTQLFGFFVEHHEDRLAAGFGPWPWRRIADG